MVMRLLFSAVKADVCWVLSPEERTVQPHLTGTLTHLTALTTKATHALLLPLLPHTSSNLEHEVKFLVLLDAVSGEGALGELVASVDETDHVAGDELLVLNHGFEVRDGGGALDGVSRRVTGGCCYDDLHVCCY